MKVIFCGYGSTVMVSGTEDISPLLSLANNCDSKTSFSLVISLGIILTARPGLSKAIQYFFFICFVLENCIERFNLRKLPSFLS